MNDGAALGLVLDQVSKDKNIDRSVLVETLEQAILTAAKRAFGMHREMEAKFNEETGRVDLFQIIIIVEAVTAGNEGKEVPLADADRFNLKADVGDELLFQIFYDEKDQAKAEEQDGKYGELLNLNRAWKGFGRIAAQTAKQVILQRVREAERENVFNQYKDRKGELISGIVRRFERGNIIVDLGGAEALLPVRDQVPRESYRAGDRIVAFVIDIDKGARGPQIVLSRTHKGLLEKLFEQEVPEIYEKIVRIESSAREPGARAKIAVSSRDRDVDPVGACVGMKGSRVQAVVQELRGEKIDIVPYSEDPARFVCNAIAPAEVSRVVIDAETHTMELIVPDDKLSLAIGKKGQNVRLASQLTGWRIDIHAESKVKELEEHARRSMAEIEGSSDELAGTLFKLGWRSAEEVARARVEEL
ncbi:MAG TPA: transcription termination factor NusA, partial [Polyangia bacterium]|nr:transcription termination factor NusA [Polyangia bacterium]